MKSFLALLALLFLAAPPDEGQWLPIQVREMDWKKLQARGMKLTKDEFWHPTKGGVLSAAIHLGGCTASFVSDDGLVITNHHCGFGAVQQLSTVETNYVRDGFVSHGREEELPTQLTVKVLRKIEDVTEQVHAAQAKAKSPVERVRATRAIIQRIVAQGEKEPNTKCDVASFFEGREYHLYYRTVLTDVRLVYAPPRSVGEYGGEVDNWEWPRHTGDFTFFRAYVSPEGKPARYSKDNVPVRPEHYLKVSEAGVHEGDLVIVMGYPGRTERYLTSTAVADREGVFYPMRHELYTNIIDRIEAACAGDEKLTLRYSSTVKSLANVQKNALGMVKGLARNATVSIKMDEERRFSEWVAADPARKEKYGTLLSDLTALDEEAAKSSLKDLVFESLMSGRTVPFFRQLVDIARVMGNAKDNQYPGAFVRSVQSRRSTVDLMNVQAPILALLIEEARKLPEVQQLEGPGEFPVGEDGVLAAVKKAIESSDLKTPEGRKALLESGREGLEKTEDPLLKLAIAVGKETGAYLQRHELDEGRRLAIGPKWIEAQQLWRGKSFYPDANSTLRVAIASVKGYSPRDGVWYPPHTTVQGILDKDTGKDPFQAPEALKKAARSRKSSAYFDPKIGDVPVCFLADGDTTGGNSGSPLINGEGAFVGLNFDRAFESVSGDYGWNKERSRNISVDVRYILWFLEQVIPAPHLLKEIREATAKHGKK